MKLLIISIAIKLPITNMRTFAKIFPLVFHKNLCMLLNWKVLYCHLKNHVSAIWLKMDYDGRLLMFTLTSITLVLVLINLRAKPVVIVKLALKHS